MNKSGVYRILNLTNGHSYIGSAARSIETRWRQHRNAARKQLHKNRHFQNAWNKYGEESFALTILEVCDRSKVLDREQFYLDFGNPEYNIHRLAMSAQGVKRSKTTKKRLSERNKNCPQTIARCRALAASQKGNQVHNSETKQRIAEASKQMWVERKSRGWNLSEEARKKIQQARKNQIFSEESRKKRSESLRKYRATRKATP